MVIASSWLDPTVRFAGEPITAALPITPCMCQYQILSLTFGRDLMEAHRRIMHILLLTQEHCGFCEQAKEILGRLSAEYNVTVSTLKLNSSEGQALAERSG